MRKNLSKQTIQRMPYYLQYLKGLWDDGKTEVSAPFIADHFGFTEIQVRKDLASVSSVQGKPKVGFRLFNLIQDIEEALGFRREHKMILVGAGSLGQSLVSYREAHKIGAVLCAVFDSNRELIGKTFSGMTVRDIRDMKAYCKENNIHMGILTVPVPKAKSACDAMVKSGIKAIWNFAQIHLSVPEGVLVQNENMTASLALLFQHLDS